MDRLECIERSRFLGREFLVWLWHESEHAEGVLPIGEGESVSLWLEEQLTLISDDLLGRHECRLKGSTPSLTNEAKEALRAGKLPVKAKIRIDRSGGSDGRPHSAEARSAGAEGGRRHERSDQSDRQPQSWSFLFDADTLGIGSVSIPALLTEEDDEKFYERMQLVEELEAMIGALFETFLRLRTSPAWERHALPAIRDWVKKDPWDE